MTEWRPNYRRTASNNRYEPVTWHHGHMSTLGVAAGFAVGVPTGALAVLGLAQRIRPKPADQPKPVNVQLYVDDDGSMRLRHPSNGVRFTESTPADLELVRDTRPRRSRQLDPDDLPVDEHRPAR